MFLSVVKQWNGIKETNAATGSDKEWQKKTKKTHTKKTIAEMTGASLQLAGLEVCSIFRPIYFNMSLVLFCYILYTVCISFPHEICFWKKKNQ